MTSRYLVFSLMGRLFGVRLSGAIEILPWRPARQVPLAYSYVAGLIDYRGTVYPVFNLALRLGLSKPGPIGFAAAEREKSAPGQSIILLEEKKIPFGIIADGVSKMVSLEDPSKTTAKTPGIDPNYVQGVVFDDDQEVMILDFERLLHAS